ncbi:hypothetical protein HHK36_010775 [Tetracentron sinense]|uniref:Uncharacterized protein n=1 Tax=Tetracentron sinense TaxID=13715 RepID=A0A834ZAZ0_TETSI|nr:hypothetical protein HHK36_010775 [Tetracentron sinense]
MGVKVATTGLHWSQPVVPHSPTYSQALASAISSPSSRIRHGSDRALVYRLGQSSLFGTTRTNLLRSRSFDIPKPRGQTPRRAYSASLDGFSDEEFSKKIQELAQRFHLSDDDEDNSNATDLDWEVLADPRYDEGKSKPNSYTSFMADFSKINSNTNSIQNPRPYPTSKLDFLEPEWFGILSELPEFSEGEEIIPARIERKGNGDHLPLPLRPIKRRKQWQEEFREVGESAYCSVRKAFSSMVFIIRELHNYTLQMRQLLFYEDLQGILSGVQKEMHASFVWLFQHVFAHTPTLMVYVMILLANFTVHSMSNNTAITAPPPQSYATTTEIISVTEKQNHQHPKFDSSAIKTFTVSSSAGVGKTTSIGGNDGGGRKVRPVSSGTDGGDGRFQVSSFGNPTTAKESESGSGLELESHGVVRDEEVKLWNSVVEEASRMLGASSKEAIDHDSMQQFVSPVMVAMEPEDSTDYFRTELLYQMGVSQEPNNPLILSNYAQFLYLVVHDHDRAEEYFKRAVGVEPGDAESLSKYASFLWMARKDLTAAEDTYLEAMAADPGNSSYAAEYAHFLWNTGAEDTCYPLNAPDSKEA